jgi:hypothetical protein
MRIFSGLLMLAMLAGCATPGPSDSAPSSTNSPLQVASPDIPDTDIYVGGLSFDGGAPVIGALENATARVGYDNQPSFLPGEAAFYYVAEGDSGKTDIRLYDIARRASQPVFTSTDRSEYSPKRTPDNARLSYIQENPEGDVTRVFDRPVDGSGDGAPVADFAPIGYYAWLDGGKALGVYYRSEPGSLDLVDVASGATMLLHEKIGRALAADRSGAHLWFTKTIDGEKPLFRLMRYDTGSGAIAALFELPPGAQDFALLPDDQGAAVAVFSAEGATLYWRTLDETAGEWRKAAEFEGVRNTTRIAVSDDLEWVAIVAEPAE